MLNTNAYLECLWKASFFGCCSESNVSLVSIYGMIAKAMDVTMPCVAITVEKGDNRF